GSMKYSEAIEPVTTLKTKSAELIRRARESGQPIVITQNGKATAVLFAREGADVDRVLERGRLHAVFLGRRPATALSPMLGTCWPIWVRS
ncbi:MAG: type II toxin-antitoxin system prevent-host-death family antitoxin, partial [Sphingomonadales bacterium]|nr:type II toxin-antitoxin system prevent-host-death family antitoxin [Sphingomonadales bacterium]